MTVTKAVTIPPCIQLQTANVNQAVTPPPGAPKRARSAPNPRIGRSLAAKVNKIISQQEKKYFDSNSTITTVAATASVVALGNVTQGDDATSRDGRKISMVSSAIRGHITASGGSPNSPFRVIIFIDKQCNGTLATAGDILQTPTLPTSFLTMETKERFRVIYDNYCSLDKGDYGLLFNNTSQTIVPIRSFVKIPDDLAQVEYGAAATPLTNCLGMLIVSVSPVSFVYNHRMRFTDS